MVLIVGGGALIAWRRSAAWAFAIVIALAALLIVRLPAWDRLRLTSGEHVYFSPVHVKPDSVLLFFREDPAGGIVTVVGRMTAQNGQQRMVRTLLTNGKFEGSDGAERIAQTGFAIVPALLTRDFNDALVIGGGTGATADVIHALGFRNVRVAEIVPSIIDAARQQFSGLNHNVFDQPNVHIDVEDGRNVLLLDRDARYDLITIELSSIWFSNATNLYSREFYRVAHSRMRPHAVIQQWLQLHHIELYDALSVIATMRSVFPYVSVWSVGGQGILVGSDEPQVIRANALEHVKLLSPRLGWTSPPQFAASVTGLARTQLLSPAAVDRMFARVRPIVNTDRNRFVEYSTPRSNLNRAATIESMLRQIEEFSDHAVPPVERQALPVLQP
jgi:spermidine synthase